MSDSDTTQASPAPAPKKRSKLLVIGLPLVVLLIGGAGVGFWYVKDVRSASATATKPKEEKEPTGLLAFEPFTVNLADPGGRRYLRLGMKLLLPDADAAKKVSDEEVRMSRLRSALIELLASQTATELGTAEGREALKRAIAERASHTGHMDVRDVLFQEFVVQ